MADPARDGPVAGIVRVFLVEDNPGDALLVEESLSEARIASFHVVRAARLDEAIDRVEEADPDVVLLDLGLPDSHGVDTLTRFTEACGEVPVVVLTGYEDGQTAVEALQAGADDYLVKQPLEPGMLARSILYAMSHRQVRGRLHRLRDQVHDLLEQMDEPVVVVDHDGVVEFVNPAARQRYADGMPEIGARLDVDLDVGEGHATFTVPGGPTERVHVTPLDAEEPVYVLTLPEGPGPPDPLEPPPRRGPA